MTRNVPAIEGVRGGFSALYPVLRALEESGRVRRGFFVSGVAALQFALPGVLERLRNHRASGMEPRTLTLAADDPANPYGSILPWPNFSAAGWTPTRAIGATVVLRDGMLIGYVARGERDLLLASTGSVAELTGAASAVAGALVTRAQRTSTMPTGLLLETIDGQPATAHVLADAFIASGFQPTPHGLQLPLARRGLRRRPR